MSKDPVAYRWVGVIGYVNTATRDHRVLALGHGDLRPFLRWGKGMPVPGATRVLTRETPLPLLHDTDPACVPLRLGTVDSVAVEPFGTRLVASGTIELRDEPGWQAALLEGWPCPITMDVDRVEPWRQKLITWRRPWRRPEFEVFDGDWRLRGAMLHPKGYPGGVAPWADCYLVLGEIPTLEARR